MGLFGSKYSYEVPERLTPSEARERRLASVLERERKSLEFRVAPLSPANQFHLNQLKDFQRKFSAELEDRRKRVQQMAERDPSLLRSLAGIAAVSRLSKLQQRQSALLQRAANERRMRSLQASAVDRRFYNPARDDVAPKTKFGTNAWMRIGLGVAARRHVRNPTIALPCLDRLVRREVMFARGHGGRAYRKRHKFTPLSLIGC